MAGRTLQGGRPLCRDLFMTDSDEIDRRVRLAFFEERQRRSDRRSRLQTVAAWLNALCAVVLVVLALPDPSHTLSRAMTVVDTRHTGPVGAGSG
jgi:hypothetical protein